MVRISLPLEETWSSIYLHAIRVDVWGGLYINSSLTIIIIRNGGCSDRVVFQIQFGCDVQFLQPLLGLTTLINMSIMVMIKNMVYMQPRVKDDSHTNCVIWKSLILISLLMFWFVLQNHLVCTVSEKTILICLLILSWQKLICGFAGNNSSVNFSVAMVLAWFVWKK